MSRSNLLRIAESIANVGAAMLFELRSTYPVGAKVRILQQRNHPEPVVVRVIGHRRGCEGRVDIRYPSGFETTVLFTRIVE